MEHCFSKSTQSIIFKEETQSYFIIIAMATLLAPAPFCPTYINNAVTNRAYVVQVQVNDSRRKWFLVLEKKLGSALQHLDLEANMLK